MKPQPWSFSRLDKFVNCPKQFASTTVYKTHAEEEGDESLWGKRVHKHFEEFVADGVVLPDELSEHEEFLLKLMALPGTRTVEEKIALGTDQQPCAYFAENVWYRGVIDFKVVSGAQALLIDYKGLPLDTLISTPTGFTTMRDVRVGDLVHASDGRAYPVTVKSQTHIRQCFRLAFDDKTEVVCDNVHLWKRYDGSVVPVTELSTGDKLPVADPVEMTEQHLLVDPYVLGVWLADGKHTSGEITNTDPYVWAEIRRRGCRYGGHIGGPDRCETRTVKRIRGRLNALGVLGNKHIPDVYMRASVAQRLDLLRGLMDGDGSVNKVRKQVVFQCTNRALSEQVLELVQSLGCRAIIATQRAAGFGKVVVTHPVVWRPRHFNPFRTPHKANRIFKWGDGRSAYRTITTIELLPEQETQCIGVESPDHTYLCARSRIVTHNTGKHHKKFKQLKTFALHTFAAEPAVNTIRAEYYWTKDRTKCGETYTRDQIPALWAEFVPDLTQYRDAFKTELWQPRPSGLCKRHCPVTDCEFNGLGLSRGRRY